MTFSDLWLIGKSTPAQASWYTIRLGPLWEKRPIVSLEIVATCVLGRKAVADGRLFAFLLDLRHQIKKT